MAESLALCDIKDIQQQLLWLPSGYLTQLGICSAFQIQRLHCFLSIFIATINFLLLGSGRQDT